MQLFLLLVVSNGKFLNTIVFFKKRKKKAFHVIAFQDLKGHLSLLG